MHTLTAILHTHNDALRIARAIESLRPCDEVLVVDHASSDETCRIAREFGARVIAAQGETHNDAEEARHDWIFHLRPTESLSEALEASIYEWKMRDASTLTESMVYKVGIEEETQSGWVTHAPEVRLTHRLLSNQDSAQAATPAESCLLEGHLLRLYLP